MNEQDKIRYIRASGFLDANGRFQNLENLCHRSVWFENRSTRAYVLLDAANMPTVIKGTDVGYHREPGLMISVKYSFPSHKDAEESIKVLQRIQNMHGETDNDTNMLLEALHREVGAFSRMPNTMSKVTVTISRFVHDHELSAKKHVFLNDFDLLMTTEKYAGTVLHPNSLRQEFRREHGEAIESEKMSSVIIEYVDNKNARGVRYMPYGNQILQLTPVAVPSKPDGVYISVQETDMHGATAIVSNTYTIEEAEVQLGFYKTREEAVSGGNVELQNNVILSQNAIKLKHAEQELQELKAKHARDLHLAEHTIEQLRHELTISKNVTDTLKESSAQQAVLRKDEQEARKEARADEYDERSKQRSDHYENRSHTRKDWTEVLKWVPLTILGALGLMGLWKKTFG